MSNRWSSPPPPISTLFSHPVSCLQSGIKSLYINTMVMSIFLISLLWKQIHKNIHSMAYPVWPSAQWGSPNCPHVPWLPNHCLSLSSYCIFLSKNWGSINLNIKKIYLWLIWNFVSPKSCLLWSTMFPYTVRFTS